MIVERMRDYVTWYSNNLRTWLYEVMALKTRVASQPGKPGILFFLEKPGKKPGNGSGMGEKESKSVCFYAGVNI